jgi:ABC-2 type transport system ATP-binding protein
MQGIEAEGVIKQYGSVTALDGVDLDVPAGTVHALAGPNGSGKTTLLGILAGLVTPTEGTVDVPEGPVGFGFQQPNLYPALSVQENLDVFTALVDATLDWQGELANRLRLEPVLHREVRALSDGYRKKLDLALAALRKPPVLLLDEPLADLDDVTRRRLVALVEDLAEPERVIVISTHELTAFAGVLDGLTILYDGRVLSEHANSAVREPAATYKSALSDLG